MLVDKDGKEVLRRVGKQYPHDEIADCICNMCGESCLDIGQLNFEMIELYTSWGFYSNKDLTTQQAHLCEKCWDEFILQLTLPPSKWDYLSDLDNNILANLL